jgi:CheY-like chemotaxis protein
VLVAVIDYRMPEMNGLQLLRHIRRRQHVSVLMVSSEEDPGLRRRVLAEGARTFLSKNTSPRLLLRQLLVVLLAALVEATMRRIRAERWDRFLPDPRSVLEDEPSLN